MASNNIKAIDKSSVHRITSGQVVVDLQTAVKELVENSLDAKATNIEIRFKNYGLKSVEVIDNGIGIHEEDFESIALKHHTSKLESYEDLGFVQTFGFRGEALSSLCALCEQVSVTTATKDTSPKGTCLEMRATGEVASRTVVARREGTTVNITNLFSPLPVRRKEFERNVKREFGKALNLLHAYALVPCATTPGVRLSVANFSEKGQKSVQLQTPGSSSSRAAVTAVWGSKALTDVVDLELSFELQTEKSVIRRLQLLNQEVPESMKVEVKGLVSKFAVGCGRANMDRQFFYINGRPCNLPKVQKAFNEVYRTFNANQSPLIIADFILPTDSCDINVSPDKRTILVHNESSLISGLKEALESHFSPSRSTLEVAPTQTLTQSTLTPVVKSSHRSSRRTEDEEDFGETSSSRSRRPPSEQDEEEPMLLDESPSGPAPPSPVKAPSPIQADSRDDIVVDTSSSQWARTASPSPQPSPVAGAESSASSTAHEQVHLIVSDLTPSTAIQRDEAPSKKRRIVDEVETPDPPESCADDAGSQGAPQPEHNRQLPARKKRHVLPESPKAGNRLAAFALPGSQIPSSARSVNDESIDGLDSDSGSSDDSDDVSPSPTKAMSPEVEVIEEEPSEPRIRDRNTPDRSSEPSPADQVEPVEMIETQVDPEYHSDLEDPSSVLSSARQSTLSYPLSQETTLSRPEIIRGSDVGPDISVRFEADEVDAAWKQHQRSTVASMDLEEDGNATKVPSAASILNADDNARAAEALSRVIDKADFAHMDIIGQFNLGFIICRRRRARSVATKEIAPPTDDLFIVDQHAADEKYNFEDLQLTTKIQSQKLLRPRPLELTAADELMASENLDVLKDNGFEVHASSEEAEGGSRLRLTAQPISKNTIFDMKDLEELIHLLRDTSSGTMVRCSKARAMFASRACRKSVMVGMPLNHTQMTTVVRHMGTMDQPWNCPHGRPTMRHLADITTLGTSPPHNGHSASARSVSWASFT